MTGARKGVPPEFYRSNGYDARATFTAPDLLDEELPPCRR